MRPTLAVVGGSFDPPHIGHALLPRYLLATGEVDQVLVAPCADHPLGKQLTPFARRMSWVRLAFRPELAGGDAVLVSPIEAELAAARDGRPSYTLELLRAVAQRHPEARVRLVVGSDITTSGETDRWHRWDRIVAEFEPIVVPRAGWSEPGAARLPEVSSTVVREQLQSLRAGGEAAEVALAQLRALVPGPVLAALRRFVVGSEPRVLVVGHGHVAAHAVPWLWDRGFVVERVGGRALVADPEVALAGVDFDGLAGAWLLVRDGALEGVAAALAGRLPATTPVLHAAGARLASDVLGPLAPRPLGALHPICSMRAERSRSRLSRASFGAAGDARAFAFAQALAGDQPILDLRGHDARARLAYHAACALVANHMAVLEDRAAAELRGQGLDARAVDRALGELMLGSLENLLAAGIPDGVTGPLSRGDRATVDAHLAALIDPETRSLYERLSASLADLLASRGRP